MPGEGEWTGRQPASAECSGRLDRAPLGLSFIYLCEVSWGVRRREMAEASLYQKGSACSWGIGNIIGLRSPLAVAPIRHFSLPISPTQLTCRHSWGDETVLAFQAPSWNDPKQELSLVLTVAFIWLEEGFFFHSFPPSSSFYILPLHHFDLSCEAVTLESWMQLGEDYP